MVKPTALQIARHIIRFAKNRGESITNLKLQKLLYYAQSWYLAFEGKTLFNDRIEAWIRGPVVPNVYRQFKRYGFNPIPVMPHQPHLSVKIQEFLDDLLIAYLPFDAFSLERMTHQEKPWKEARKNMPPDVPCCNKIKESTMKQFFTSKVKSN